MEADNYSKVRFIGYAIPTGPCQEQVLLSKYLIGNYLGSIDFDQDINARIAILKNAVDIAKAALPSNEDITKVNNIFVAPEFYFHGYLGPYIYDADSADPAKTILNALASIFNVDDYPNWTFVFGTVVSAKVANIAAVFKSHTVRMRKELTKSLAITAQVQFGNARSVTEQILSNTINDLCAYPAVEVRDRALIFSNLSLGMIDQSSVTNQMTTEKYFLSPIDFLLFEKDDNDVVTEEMVAYPYIDLSDGDIKKNAFDEYALFSQDFGGINLPRQVNIGVEICLDHDDARLRKNMNRNSDDCGGMHIQIIPSSGSMIVHQSVAVNRDGFVFNCDGWCAFDDTCVPQQGVENGIQFVYTNYIFNCGNTGYKAHTQLARVASPAKGDDPNFSAAEFQALTVIDAISISVKAPVLIKGSLEDYFAGGAGAIHIYGLNDPYKL